MYRWVRPAITLPFCPFGISPLGFCLLLAATSHVPAVTNNKTSTKTNKAPPVQQAVTVRFLQCSVFKCPRSFKFMKISKTLLHAPVAAWFTNIITWCLGAYDHCVCFVRRVQNPDSESTELLYQPGIICMYDPQTLRAWTFEVIEEDPALCVGSDLTYIPLSGSSHFLTTTLRTMHLKKKKKFPCILFFQRQRASHIPKPVARFQGVHAAGRVLGRTKIV